MPKYIDAELLKVAMVFNPKLGDLTVPEMRDILTEIDSAPAADVESVRHGKWVYGSDAQFHCSCCDKVPLMEVKCLDETVWKLKEIMASFIKWCPECGAKMDVDAEAEAETV